MKDKTISDLLDPKVILELEYRFAASSGKYVSCNLIFASIYLLFILKKTPVGDCLVHNLSNSSHRMFLLLMLKRCFALWILTISVGI